MVTGPVFVRGALPGDTLQVDILSVAPTMDFDDFLEGMDAFGERIQPLPLIACRGHVKAAA